MRKNLMLKLQRKLAFVVMLTFGVQIFGVQVHFAFAQDAKDTSRLVASLNTTGNQNVWIDGKKAVNGTVIQPGARIETLADSGADVQIGHQASLKIFPNTKASLYFNEGNSDIKVETGSATLFVEPAFSGSVTTPIGEKKIAASAQTAQINSNELASATDDDTGTTDPQSKNKPKRRIGGLPWSAFAALLIASGGLVLYFIIHQNNGCSGTVSPIRPGC